jgi:hypothetical protein
MLELCAGAAIAPSWKSDAPGLHLLAFAIAPGERESWRGRLSAAGHPVCGETGFTLYVRDPFGNRLGLSHYPQPAVTT